MELEKTSVSTLANFLTLRNLDFIGSLVVILFFLITFSIIYNKNKDDKRISKSKKNFEISVISISTILFVGSLLTFSMYPGVYTYLENYIPLPFLFINSPILLILIVVGRFVKS